MERSNHRIDKEAVVFSGLIISQNVKVCIVLCICYKPRSGITIVVAEHTLVNFLGFLR